MAHNHTTIRIGIDLGGTKISAIAIDNNGKALARTRVATPRNDYRGTIAQICDIVTQLEQETKARGSIGIGMPGSLSPASGLVQNANSIWLNGRSFKEDLREKLGRELRFANDANCFALSEAIDGAGKSAASVFGVIIGTGCGGGFVFRGKLVDGPRGIAGEWGHTPLPWPRDDELPGPRCWCGREGCIESWVAGPALSADHLAITGQELSAVDIAKAAQQHSRAAMATIARHANRLARGLAVVTNILDPEVIILGGGLSQMSHLYDDIPRLMAPYIFSDDRNVSVLAPKFGDDSGVRGAARLWETEV